MNTSTKRLLTHLHRAGQYSYFWTAPGKTSTWFSAGNPGPEPRCKQNVYFGVNPTTTAKDRHHRAKVEDIAAVNCLFAEFDCKDFGTKEAITQHLKTLPMPSAIVDSGGGHHCYWLLREPYKITSNISRDRAKRVQAAWVQYTGGDKAAKDLARVLRLPGSKNYKYGPDYPTVKIEKFNPELLYTFDELERLCKPKRRPPRPRPANFDGDVSRIQETLKRLDSSRTDNYHNWINVGMALSELGDDGLLMWENWSQQSEKYRPGECERKWRSFEPGHGLTLGSLFYWANQDDPRPAMSASRATRPETCPKAPRLKSLQFESELEPADFEQCPAHIERAVWSSESGTSTSHYYCNDPATCQLDRERHALKLGYWLQAIADRAYIDDNGTPAYALPVKNEAGEFTSAAPGNGVWYGKILAWGNERRNFAARYRRARPGGYPKPEIYPIMDAGKTKYVVLSLCPFEDMEPVELTDDLLKRITIGAPGCKASLLFGPPRRQLALALPRYTFEIPPWLGDREIVTAVKAAHSVVFSAQIETRDVYSSFNTRAQKFEDIELTLQEIGLKATARVWNRIRGVSDKEPDFTLRYLSITPGATDTYLSVWNAGRAGDKATIDRHKLKELPTLPRYKRVDKAIETHPSLKAMALSTHSTGYWEALTHRITHLHQIRA